MSAREVEGGFGGGGDGETDDRVKAHLHHRTDLHLDREREERGGRGVGKTDTLVYCLPPLMQWIRPVLRNIYYPISRYIYIPPSWDIIHIHTHLHV
jgi:hypothetical protein